MPKKALFSVLDEFKKTVLQNKSNCVLTSKIFVILYIPSCDKKTHLNDIFRPNHDFVEIILAATKG